MTDFVDFATLERPPKPNTYLLAPKGLCQAAKPDANSPVFEEAPAELFSKVQTLVGDTPRWGKVRSDEAGLKLAFVASTALLRFKDDIDIQVLPGDDGSGARIAIYSRSRIGHSDLGANRKRVAKFIHELTSN
ncbi:MAG: DUF1499 domain-containing protein [Pseudomonadota bacterium]